MQCVLCNGEMTQFVSMDDPYNLHCFVCNFFACNIEEEDDFGKIKENGKTNSFLIMKQMDNETYGLHSEMWIDEWEYFVVWKDEGIFDLRTVGKMAALNQITQSRKLLPEEAMETLERLIKLQSFQ